MTQSQALTYVKRSLSREGRQLIDKDHGVYILCRRHCEGTGTYICEWWYGDFGFVIATSTGALHKGYFETHTIEGLGKKLAALLTSHGM